MPDMYDEGEYDLAGFCVGVVERQKIIDGRQLRPGDRILGLASSGPHSNGYSLIRKILQRCAVPVAEQVAGQPLLDLLLAPTRIYVRSVLALLARIEVRAMAHITGGGLTENIIRVVPDGLAVQLDATAWPRPPVFDWLAATGEVVDSEMARTFNLGIGYVVIVAPELAAEASELLRAAGEQVWRIGEVVEQGGGDRLIWR